MLRIVFGDVLDRGERVSILYARVADRPDRFEPRVKKRRRNHNYWRPRTELKRDMAKEIIKI